MSNPVRILIAEDHYFVRAGLRSLLEQIEDFLVVGEASDGVQALALTTEQLPDVLVLDIGMPELTGLELLELLLKHDFAKKVHVVILSMHNDEEHVLRALKLGALAYVLKAEAPSELEKAIRSALRGIPWLSQSLSHDFAENYLSGNGIAVRRHVELTVRQTEVLRFLAHGLSTKEIAAELGISAKTVETYRAQLMDRLDIRSLAGLVRYAIRNHYIAP
jgi:DNA-binding NarL/FixJ family response regulator